MGRDVLNRRRSRRRERKRNWEAKRSISGEKRKPKKRKRKPKGLCRAYSRPKISYPREAAKQEAHRLANKYRLHRFAAYRCDACGHYHVGKSGAGPEEREERTEIYAVGPLRVRTRVKTLRDMVDNLVESLGLTG